MTNSRAKKFDSGKPDLSLIPRVALDEEARAFMYGAEKYGRHNFHKGMEVSRLVAAALRHITAYNEGSNVDSESGVSHLGHARACLSMILKQHELCTLIDDRANAVIEAEYINDWDSHTMHEIEFFPMYDIFGEHNSEFTIIGFTQTESTLAIDLRRLGDSIKYNSVAGHPEYSCLTYPDGSVRYINVSAEGLDSIAYIENYSRLDDEDYNIIVGKVSNESR